MSYYGAGDYYAAGGFLGGLLGGITGFITGGPTGAIGGAVKGFKSGGKGSEPLLSKTGGGLQLPQERTPGLGGFLQRMVPGGESGYTCPAGTMAGYHANKSGYWTNDGVYHAPGTVMVKNRSMNPGNARALRRGIRREQAFVALAKRALKGTGITVSRRSFGRKPARKR